MTQFMSKAALWLALGCWALGPGAGIAGEEFTQAFSAGQQQLKAGKNVDDYRKARGCALASLRLAQTGAERTQAAALLAEALRKLAGVEKIAPREQLTLLLQAAGAAGLRGDFAAMEKEIAAAVKQVEQLDVVDQLAGLLSSDPTSGAGIDAPTLEAPHEARVTPARNINLGGKIMAFWDAAVFYAQARENAVARVLTRHKDALHASAAMPINSYLCRFVPAAPTGVAAWAQSAIVSNPAQKAAGFYPAPKEVEGKEPLLFDLLADRSLTDAEKQALVDKTTSFFMVYDTRGWHIYLQTDRRGGKVEMYIAPSLKRISPIQCRFTLPDSASSAAGDLQAKYGGFQVETAAVGQGWGTAIFIPWEHFYGALPFLEDDAVWGFTIVRRSPVNTTWGGREREPGRWGLIRWEAPPAAQRLAIQRQLIGSAWRQYQAEKGAATDGWNDPQAGDREFYRAAIQPLLAGYEAYGERMAGRDGWDQAAVAQAFQEVPAWMDFPGKISELRRDYLLRKLTGGDGQSAGPTGRWEGQPFACYVVPAISAVSRTPDSLPTDGKLANQIGLVGAQGETLPASFVVVPRQAVAKFELQAGALRRVAGEGAAPAADIPAANVDLKVVKCWWQPGRAWYSYMDDYTRRELMPDLLLHDETLIKIDLENREHYLRVGAPGSSNYIWASYRYPRHAPGLAGGDRMPVLPGEARVDYFKEPIADSPELRPVALEPQQNKQFWITVKVPADAGAGLYEGRIALSADGVAAGELALRVRVLPFQLPDPMTAYDLTRPFIVAMDGLGSLSGQLNGFGGDRAQAEKRLRANFKNQREHNIYNYSGIYLASYNYYYPKNDPVGHRMELANVMDNSEQKAILVRNLELVKEAGFKPPLIGIAAACITQRTKVLKGRTNEFSAAEVEEIYNRYMRAARELLDLVENVMGHREVYFWGAGEPEKGTLLNELDGFKALQAIGVKIGTEGQPWHLEVAGDVEDLINLGGAFFDRKYTDPWHARGHRVIWYAGPHPGAKNPVLSRRAHGLQGYQAHFDGTKNNTWGNSWLDFFSPYGYHITMIYPTQNGVIDTLQWEGFREGIGDIRYATKLKLLAAAAAQSGDAAAQAGAKTALTWLEQLDAKTAELNAVRLEMIRYILQLARVPMEP